MAMALGRWLLAMAAVAGAWVVAGAVLCALGGAVARLTGLRGWDPDRLFVRYWVGLAVILALAQAAHLVLPLDAATSAALLLPGLLAVAWAAPQWRRAWRVSRWPRPWVVVSLLALAWLANRAIGLPDVYDTRMYHINVVRWANEYPAVPGIVHLQRPIAFNNAHHLLAACLDHGWLDHASHHVANGLFLVPLAMRALLGLSRISRRLHGAGTRAEPADGYYAAMLLPVAALAVRPELSSLSSDLPAGVLVIVLGGELLGWLTSGQERARWSDRLLVLACLPPLAICVKLSVLASAATAWAVLCVAVLASRPRPGALAGLAAAVAIASAALLLPWAARGVVLSGYPVFPIAVGGMPVEWRASESALHRAQDWIAAHARGATQRKDLGPWLRGWDWLGPWARKLGAEEVDRLLAPLALVVAGVAALPMVRWWPVAVAAAAPGLIGGLVWFWQAPAYRMGFGFAWSVAGVVVAATVASIWERQVRPVTATVAVAALAALPLVAVAQGLVTATRNATGERSLTQVLWPVVYPPARRGGFHEFDPGGYREVRSRWGARYHIGDMNDFIWYVPLPAAISERPDLRERVPGNPGAGYVLDPSPASQPPTIAPDDAR